MTPLLLSRTVVVLPALDEEDSVVNAIQHWQSFGAAEVRVVDNGSRDATAERAAAAGAVVITEPARGYGAAARAGTCNLPDGADWILFASADGSDYLDEPAARAFDDAVRRGARLIIGERVSRPEARSHLSIVQRFGNRLCCELIAVGWRTVRFRDMGSLRLIHRGTFDDFALQDRSFGWNIEMQIAAIERGTHVEEVPVGYRPRTAGEAKISGSLRGIFRAGRDIIGMLAKLWWRSRNHSPCVARTADPARSLPDSPAP